MPRDPGWLMSIQLAMASRLGKWRIWTPPLDNAEGDSRYYLQRWTIQDGPVGKQGAWQSEPEGGFATLDDLAVFIGCSTEQDYIDRYEQGS